MRFPQTQLHKDTTVGCKVSTLLKRCVVQVSVTDTSINHNNYVKRLDYFPWLCLMAQTTGIFLGWTGYFQRNKSGGFEGKNPVISPIPAPCALLPCPPHSPCSLSLKFTLLSLSRRTNLLLHQPGLHYSLESRAFIITVTLISSIFFC